MLRRIVLSAALALIAPRAYAQRSLIAAAYGGTVPPQCVSAYVDLANLAQCRCVVRPPPVVMKGQTMISARDTCGDALERRAIGGLVDLGVSVTPSPLRGGAQMTVVISIKNTSRADTEMARGGECGQGFSASNASYLVVLPPAGIAEWKLPWQAATRVTDRACNPTWWPLTPGTYALAVPVLLWQLPNAVARGTMLVQ